MALCQDASNACCCAYVSVGTKPLKLPLQLQVQDHMSLVAANTMHQPHAADSPGRGGRRWPDVRATQHHLIFSDMSFSLYCIASWSL
jgi:hypothetical protein